MNRLTYEADSNSTGYGSKAEREKLIAWLAEYENTGYTPEEIYAIRRRCKQVAGTLWGLRMDTDELRECIETLHKCSRRSREGKL